MVIVRDVLPAICELVSQRTGLWLSSEMQQRMERLLPRRMALGSYRQSSEYYHFLKDNPFGREEIARLASLLTNRKPRLMNPELSGLVNDFAKAKAAKKALGLAVMAVGTAAGEDIYTAAIALGRAGVDVTSPAVRITAADIGLDRLLRGADGVYTARAVADVSPEDLEEYFDQPAKRSRRVKRALRNSVRWLYADPLHGWEGIRCRGACDLIICRELLNRLTFSVLKTWTNPGGLLAHGGMLICDRRIDLDGPFDLTQHGKYWAYTKPAEALRAPPYRGRPAGTQSDVRFIEALHILEQANIDEAERALTSALRGDPFSAPHRVAMALLLVRKNVPTGARTEALAALSLEPHSPYALLSCGVAYESLNELRAAEQFYRKALLVRPTMAAARHHLAKLHAQSDTPQRYAIA